MALTRTEDKTDKAIARLLLQNPMGLTIGDITAEAKCTPQTARKSLARIGADKDASGMLYVLRDDDEQAAPAPEPAPDVPAPEQAAPDPAPAAVAEVPEPLRRGDLVVSNGGIYVVIEVNHADNGYWIHAMTGNGGQDYARAKELTRVGSIRKKIKRLKAAIAKAEGES